MDPAAHQSRSEQAVAEQATKDSAWTWCSVASVDPIQDGAYYVARRSGPFCSDLKYFADVEPDCSLKVRPKEN